MVYYTIHHLLEYMGSAFKDNSLHCQPVVNSCSLKALPIIQVRDVLCYKPIPIIYRTSLLKTS